MIRLSPLALAVALAACGTPEDTTGDTDTDTTATPSELTVRFDATLGGQPVGCGSDLADLGDGTAAISLTDLRFYVSNVELLDDDGNGTPVTLTADGQWQQDDLVLIDLEDGTGGCGAAMGNPELNDLLLGTVDAGDWTTIAFDLGVPFERNHADTSTADAPLDMTALFWNWQIGHKFLRLDLKVDDASWYVHLGSTACSSSGSAASPEVACDKTNLSRIELPLTNLSDTVVHLELDGLFDGVDVQTNTAKSPPGCMSGPEDAAECTELFANLGLDYSTGDCTTDCTDQIAFTAE